MAKIHALEVKAARLKQKTAVNLNLNKAYLNLMRHLTLVSSTALPKLQTSRIHSETLLSVQFICATTLRVLLLSATPIIFIFKSLGSLV